MNRVSQAALAVAALASAAAIVQPARADAVADFYSGRNLTIVIGFSPGGGVDTFGRLLGRHIGKHLPGNPNVVAQNMPGGGGLKSTNYVYNAAPKDGSYITIMLPTNAIEPLMGNANAKWDTFKLQWLGNLTKDSPACVASGRSGLKSIAEAKDREITVGATGPSSTTAQHPFALAKIFGYKIKVITGYGGTSEVRLAMEKGEVDAMCSFWASLALGAQKADMDSGKLVPLVQMGAGKHRAWGDAPLVHDLARNDDERKLAQFVYGVAGISRPFAAPPEVPADRVAALRAAFWAAATSPELKAEADRMKLIVDPMNWQETEAAFREALASPKEIIDRAKEVIRK